MNTAHLLSLLVFAVMLTMLAAKPRYSIYERVARLEDWKQKMEDSHPVTALNREVRVSLIFNADERFYEFCCLTFCKFLIPEIKEWCYCMQILILRNEAC